MKHKKTELEVTEHVVYAVIYLEDKDGKVFHFQASSFIFDLKEKEKLIQNTDIEVKEFECLPKDENRMGGNR